MLANLKYLHIKKSLPILHVICDSEPNPPSELIQEKHKSYCFPHIKSFQFSLQGRIATNALYILTKLTTAEASVVLTRRICTCTSNDIGLTRSAKIAAALRENLVAVSPRT